IGKYLAIDCEMVGVGPNGSESALARVSIVNFYGHPVLDKFVKPKEKITDYRTFVSGITPAMMRKAESFEAVQKEVAELLEDRIVVGHAVHNDFKALMISHPRHLVRDTQLYKPFRKLTGGRTPGLKRLVELVLKRKIQAGEHSSVEDAAATMELYRSCKETWDREM
ncbi:ribonuclease H-like domain-containing protein, partial [Thamnocephalis sphaerospora]